MSGFPWSIWSSASVSGCATAALSHENTRYRRGPWSRRCDCDEDLSPVLTSLPPEASNEVISESYEVSLESSSDLEVVFVSVECTVSTFWLWRASPPVLTSLPPEASNEVRLRVQQGELRVVFRSRSYLCGLWLHSLDVATVTVTSISFLSWQVFLQRRPTRWAQSPTRWA